MDEGELVVTVADESGTRDLASRLAAELPPTAVIGLQGELGAGKTRFVQFLAEALGVDRRCVVSPTFVLLSIYEGDRRIHHFDAYRLKSIDEFLNLGPEEYFAATGISIVEWADRVAPALPRERLDIAIDILDANSRRFHLQPMGGTYAALVRRLGAA